jgi:hypothetical protein
MLLPDAEFVHATEKAVLFRWKGAEVWFPRSQVQTWPESWQKTPAFSVLVSDPKLGSALEIKDFMAAKAGITTDGVKPVTAEPASKEDNQRKELARLQQENTQLRQQVAAARQAQSIADTARNRALQDVQRLQAEVERLRNATTTSARNATVPQFRGVPLAVPPAKEAKVESNPSVSPTADKRDWSLLEVE